MNHLGNIWQTINALLQVNNFDKHFDNGTPEFKTLLEDDGIITEFKNCSSKLMNYMKLEQYEQLIRYIIEMPTDEDDKSRAFKFPFVACELLTADIQQIYDMFLNYKDESSSENDEYREEQDEKMEKLELINFDEDDASNFQCKKCKMGFNEVGEYIEHTKKDTCQYKNDNSINYGNMDDGPQYRQSIKGKGKNIYNSRDSNDGDMNSRVSELEKKMAFMMNGQQSYNEFEKLQADLRKEKDKNNKYYLKLQEYVDTVNDKKEIINSQNALIRKLRQQMKQQQEEIRELKALQNPDEQDSIENMRKEGQYLLVYLWQFLNVEEEVNQTLAGYFTKVMTSLVNKKETEIIDFFYSKTKYIDNLIRQVQSRSLAELLLRFLTFESTEVKQNYLDIRQNILQELSNKINQENTDWETKQNCTYIIGETMRKWQNINSGTEIFEFILQFLQGKIVEGLIAQNDSVVYNNTVLCNIIFQNLHSQKVKIEDNNLESGEENQYKEFDDQSFINSLEENISKILDTLVTEPKNPEKIVKRNNIKPLGITKLKTVEMIQWIFQYNRTELNTAIAGARVFEKILQLFIENEWNNVLHNRIEKIIVHTLEIKSITLLRDLFQNGDLIGVFKRNTEKLHSDIFQKDKKQIFRKGFLGHIAKIGNILKKMNEADEQIREYINESKEDWESFNKHFLNPQNDKDNRELGGHSLQSEQEAQESDNVSFTKEDASNKYKDFLSDSGSQQEQDEEDEILKQEKPDLEEDFDTEEFVKEDDDDQEQNEEQTVEQIIEKNQENQKNSQVTQNVDDFDDVFVQEKEEEKQEQEQVQNPTTWEEFDMSDSNQQQNKQENSELQSAFDSFGATPSAQSEEKEEEEKSEQNENKTQEDKSSKYEVQDDEEEEVQEQEEEDDENKEEEKENLQQENNNQQEQEQKQEEKEEKSEENQENSNDVVIKMENVALPQQQNIEKQQNSENEENNHKEPESEESN